MKDIYDYFAFDYDEFGPIEEYWGDEKNLLDNLFVKNNVKTVLDCACGTGQHLYMLSQLGYQVSGSDYSASMLQVAKKILSEHKMNISLYQCDFRHLITVLTLSYVLEPVFIGEKCRNSEGFLMPRETKKRHKA